MTMLSLPQRPSPRDRGPRAAPIVRLLAAALLGLAAALLVSCASSGKGLIPASAAGPLKSDFEAVQQAAESANGDCAATEAALLTTAEDFAALPPSVDAGLRNNLRQGIANLRVRAHEMCLQPSAQSTTTTTTPKTTTSTPTTTSTATTTSTSTTPTTPTSTTPTTPGPGGGTPAPGESPTGGGEPGGNGEGEAKGGSGGAGGGVGAGGQEAGK